MRLSARMLENVVDENTFDHAPDGARFTSGDAPVLYFQLIDLNKDESKQGFSPAGRRYVPEDDADLEVVLDNIDDDLKLTRSATQPFDGDPSIWSLELMTTDHVEGTVTMRLTLTEGDKVTRGSLRDAIRVCEA